MSGTKFRGPAIVLTLAFLSGALLLGQDPLVRPPAAPGPHPLQTLGRPMVAATAGRPGFDVLAWRRDFATLSSAAFRAARPGTDVLLRGSADAMEALLEIDADTSPSSIVLTLAADRGLTLGVDGAATGLVAGVPVRVSASFYQSGATGLARVPGGFVVSGTEIALWAERGAGREPLVVSVMATFGSIPPANSAVFGAPQLSATLLTDADGNAVVSPGDTLRYTLRIPNIGDTAMTNVVANLPLDANTAAVAGSLNTSPIALDQAVATNEDVALPITLTGSDADGNALTYTIVTLPAHGGVVQASPGGAGVTYTPAADYNGPDSFTVRNNDGRVSSNEDATITVTVGPVNDAPSFTKGADQSVVESSPAQSVPGWATAMSPGPANESAQTITFEITNNTAPALFSVAPAVSPAGTLTYTPAPTFNGTATISILARDSGGTAGGGVDVSAVTTFTITIRSVNDAPSFTKGSDPTVLEDSGVQTVPGWATGISPGVNEAGQTVSFEVTGNNNPALFAAGPAVASNGTLTFTPAANLNGSATITLRARDDGGTSDGGVDVSGTQSFVINVTAVNDAPSFTKGADQTNLEDSGAHTVASWATAIAAGPANEAGQTLTFAVTNNTNPGLFAVAPAVSSAGTLTYTFAANMVGAATITLQLSDNGGTANSGADTSAAQTFVIATTEVNDAPGFTKGANQTVLEDAGPQTVAGWATALSPGPNESGQVLTFEVTNNTNAALFSAGPVVNGATGTLTYTSAPNAVGTATITLRIHDDGGTADGGVDVSPTQQFTITVDPVNDAPSFTKGADVTVLEESGANAVAGWATAISKGGPDESGQTLTFVVTINTNAGLFSAGPAVDATGNLTFTPALNAFGTAAITLRLNDNGGILNGGADQSPTQTFNITVTNVNDAPSFTKGADQTVLEDAGAQTVNPWATAIGAGANEGTQNVTFQITGNTNAALFSAGPSVSPAGVLTYTPAANANGSATITLHAADDGGTANGGVDVSPAQTFVINVTAVNDAPTADDDAYGVGEGLTLTVPAPGVLDGDTDVEGTTLTTVLVTGPAHASFFALNTNGSFTYTHDGSETTTDTFTYRAFDGALNSNLATVTITIAPINDPPIAVNDSFGVNEGATLTVPLPGVLGNDSDAEGNPTTAVLVTGPAHASTFSLNPNGSFTYTHDGSETTADSFTYRASDGLALSNIATVTITIAPVNDPPVIDLDADDSSFATGGNYQFTFTEGDPATPLQDIDAVVTDADHTTLTSLTVTLTNRLDPGFEVLDVDLTGFPFFTKDYDVTTDPLKGVLTITSATPQPIADYQTLLRRVKYSNTDLGPNPANRIVTFVANDGTDNSAAVTTTITVVSLNNAPVAVADSYGVNEGGSLAPVAPGVLGNDTDGDGDTLTAVLVIGPSHASSFTLNPDGSFTYVHDGNGFAADSFTYKANDGFVDSNVVTVTITVTSVNDAPSFTKGADVSVAEDTGLHTAAGWATAISAGGAEESAQVLTFNASNNNNPLFSVQPAVAADGTLTFTPAANAFGAATVTLTLSDDGGVLNGGVDTSAPQTFVITVTPVNDDPALNVIGNLTIPEDAPTQTVNLAGITAGPNEGAQPLQITAISNNPGLVPHPGVTYTSPQATGSLAVTPAANQFGGPATITVTVTDGGLDNDLLTPGDNATFQRTFTVTVTPVNDGPVVGAGGTLAYTEAQGPVQLSDTVTVTDIDSANVASAVVQITGNYVNGQDVLAFADIAPIAGTWDAPTGTLTLSGTDTVANYQAALRTITYENTSNAPSVLPRTVSYSATDDGAATGPTATRTIAITSNNTTPTLAAGGTLAYTENQAATAIDTGVTVTDPDSNIAGATVQITGNYASGQDVLAFANTASITGVFTPLDGTMTLSGSDTPANYQAALRTITYANTSDNPSTLARTVTWIVNDGEIASTAATSAITVAAVNDAPIVTAGNTLGYTENDPATAIAPALLVTDADSSNITGGTVAISVNYQNGQDVLSFTNTASITGSFVAGTGILTLSGTDTVANYQAALRAVRYNNTSENPSTLARTVQWIVTDGTNPSVAQTSTVNVTSVNDAPLLTAGATLGYIENGAAAAIDTTITVSDLDSTNITGATVTISANFQNGADVLGFTNQNGITGSYLAGVLTLSGTTTTSNYQTALRSVTYVNTSEDPSAAARTITWIATDGVTPSTGVTSTVNVTAVNDAPVVTAGGTLAYTENDPATAVQATVTVTDVDNANLTGATVQITGNYVTGQDVLSFTDANGITGSFSAGTGTMTLSGSATVANYQLALRAVRYTNTSESPSTLARTVTWLTTDGTTPSIAKTSTINVTAANDVPVLTAGATLAYTENDPAAAIDTTITVADVDTANLASATVVISANYQNGSDVLAFTNAFGITGAWVPATATLTLTGPATPANFQAALRTVTFANTSDSPTTTPRTITWRGNDGTGQSVAVTSTINVTAVNDAPVVIAGGTLAYTENQAAAAIRSTLTVTDADSANLIGATVQITGGYVNGEDVLSFVNALGITGSFNAGSGTMTLSGTTTVANYQTALRAVLYNNTSENPTTAGRTVTFQVNDNGAENNLSAPVTTAITVTAVNDPPTAANKNFTAETNMPISIGAATGLLNGATDPDNGVNGCSTTLTVNSGSFSATSPAGGVVTLDNADGSFTFTPPPGVTGSVTFTYTIQDTGCPGAGVASSPITVTFTVSGPVIWFVNAAAAGGGNGTLGLPFNTLAGADGVDAASHRVFLYNGTYATGLTLNSSEWLVSQGAAAAGAAAFDTFMGISPPAGTMARPAMTGVAASATVQSTVTMATSGVLNGIAISSGAATGFAAGAVTGFTVVNTTVSSSAQAISVSGATPAGAAAFTSTTSTGGATGISLDNAAGTWAFGSGALTNNSTAAFVLTNAGTAAAPVITYGGTINPTAAGRVVDIGTGSATSGLRGGSVTLSGTIGNSTGSHAGIRVQNSTAGTIAFTNTVNGTTSPAGVNLANDSGATVNFTGGLTLSTSGGAAFSATGGGTVNVTGATNTLTTTSGTAVNIVTPTNIGASGVTFRSIASNGPTNAIVLNGTSGAFTVTGDGATSGGLLVRNGTGGTIQNTGGDSVLLTNASNVTLKQLNITNAGLDGVQSTGGGNIVLSAVDLNHPGNSNPAVGGDGFGSGNGWRAENITGTNSFDNNSRVFNWQSSQSNGVLLHNTNTNFTSFTVDHALISTSATGADGFLAHLNGATTGDVNLTNSELTLIDQDGAQITNNGSGTIDAIVQKNNFHDADATSGDGNNTLYVTNSAGGRVNFTIGGPTVADANTFHNLARLITLAGVLQVDATSGTAAGGQLNGTIQFNNIWNDAGFVNGRRAIDVQVEAQGGHSFGTLAVAISNNTVNNVDKQGIHISAVSVAGSGVPDANWTIQNNSLGAAATNNGIRVGTEGDVDSGSAIEFETNVDVTTSGADLVNKLLIQNNVGVNNANNATGATLDVANLGGTAASGTTSTLHATILNNSFTNNSTTGGHVVDVLNSSLGDGETLNLNISGNNTTLGASTAGEIRLRQLAGTFNIQGGSGAVSGNNSGDTVSLTGSFGTVGSVTLPSLPTSFLAAALGGVDAVERPFINAGDFAASGDREITQADLDAIVAAARRRWAAAGLTAQQAAVLQRVQLGVQDLAGLKIGESSDRVTIGRKAGAYAWFVDPTPDDDAEFSQTVSATRLYTTPDGAPAGRVDLLTAVLHEIGHQLNLADSYSAVDRDNLMFRQLTTGERRLPAFGQAAPPSAPVTSMPAVAPAPPAINREDSGRMSDHTPPRRRN